jgi:hypothetical protein
MFADSRVLPDSGRDAKAIVPKADGSRGSATAT